MNREQAPATEPIDYVTRWRQMVRDRDEQGRRLDALHRRPDIWGGPRAERFRRMSTAPGREPLAELIGPVLTPATTVLDVGAGAGRHVVRIAPKVARVVAVEPSPAMREQLGQVIQEAGLTNVEVIPGRWPEVEVGPADVVICSHVTYFAEEIEPFLQRLRAVTRERAFVVHRFVQRERAILELFERVWGEPRALEPTFVDLFGVAAQLGLWGKAATIPFGGGPTFSTLDDATATIRADLLNPSDPRAESTIRDYLAERLVEREGRLEFDQPPAYAGVLWWEGGA